MGNDLCIPFMENILVVDNGCDQTIVNINCFLIQSFAGIQTSVGGALNSMTPSTLELVNESFTLVTLPNKCKVIFQINQAFLDRDPLQTEALLQPHQMRAFGIIVDDCAKRHLGPDNKQGGQCIRVDGTSYPMHFDGWKCYFQVHKPEPADLTKYPIIELTSPKAYEPQRKYCRRVHQPQVSLEQWRARLGYPTFEVTKATLNHNTNMVKTLQAETREYMRDHYKTRTWPLRPRRIDDVMYSDTFFSNIKSVRGYKCFQLFAYKYSKFERVHLMKREANAPEAYEDVIRSVGAPNKTVTDNATVLTGHRWTTINRKYCIETGLTIPHHQHQNYAEGIGGCFKLAVIKLFHNTPRAPLSYWCYAASFLDKTRRFLSKSSLNGKTGFQLIKGETGDISIFRFAWFEPIWFYSPSSSFPRDKMKAGYFLDVADCTGDGFSYEILPVN